MTNTNPPASPRRKGLGGLLTGGPDGAAPDGATPAPAPADPAPAPGRPAARATEMDTRGAPALLPRTRSRRVPRDKLTVNIPVSLIDGLTTLVERDGTRRYDEVEEALRRHLTRKKIELIEES